MLKDTDANSFVVAEYERPSGGLTHEMWLEKKYEDKQKELEKEGKSPNPVD